MGYLASQPTSAAYVTDTFSGTGSQTDYQMTVAPASTSSMLVAINGAVQDPSTYAILGMTLRFSEAPPADTQNISVRYLGLPAAAVANTAYRTVNEFTATAGQATYTPASYTVGFINVYQNGVRLGAEDYTATDGIHVTLAIGANAGDLITIESFNVSSVLNAMQANAGAVTSALGYTPVNKAGDMITGPLEVRGSLSAPQFTISRSEQTNQGLSVLAGGGETKFNNYEGTNTVFPAYIFTATKGTTTVEQMRIDGSGRVTMPYQPAFCAITNVYGPYNWNTVVFGYAVLNRGGFYNTANGRFTAQVAGVYSFDVSFLSPNDMSAFDFRFYVNNSSIGMGGYSGYGTNGYKHGSCAIRYYLNVGDFIEVVGYGSGNYLHVDAAHNIFSGHLIG